MTWKGCLIGEVTGFPRTEKAGRHVPYPIHHDAVRGQQPLNQLDSEERGSVFLQGKKFNRELEFLTPKRLCGDLHDRDAALDYLYQRVWFVPTEVNAGFITSEQEHTVYIWNAFQDQSVTVSSVTEQNPEGTSLNYLVPYTLGIMQEIEWTLTVLAEGPSTQDTYYKPIVNSVEYSLHILGSRLLSISPEPNWKVEPKIVYSFQTVKSVNKFFVEQRRPLIVEPRRKISVTFLLNEVEAQATFNTLTYAHDKILAVPIYNEGMIATSLAQDLTRIVFTQSHEYLWNFNNLCEHIILIDHASGDMDVEEIDNIDTTTSVEITAGLPKAFDTSTTIVYPSIPCLVKSLSYDEYTDDVVILKCEFEEFWLSG